MQSLVVFCGSRTGNNPLYEAHTKALGQIMIDNSIGMVYGGGGNGLMGTIANTVMEGGGSVIGIMPKILVNWENQHTRITELKVVEDMHVRKRMMYELCDAAIVLPGGFGSMDELFEILTWNALKIHDKPIFLLNSGGFYNPLIEMMHTMFASDFLYDSVENKITILREPGELLQYL